MPKRPGSTSDNYVFSSTHSHSRTHSVTTYSVADRLVGIGTLSYTELSFVILTLFQTLRATRHTRCVRKVSNLRSYTERKNLIESKRSWPMRYLSAANEIIYLNQ